VLGERKELQRYVVKLVLLIEIGVKLSYFLSLHVWPQCFHHPLCMLMSVFDDLDLFLTK